MEECHCRCHQCGARVRPSEITPREREVMIHMANGLSTSVIADRLCVSIKTIESHRKQIYSKTGVNNIADLTKYCIIGHYIELPEFIGSLHDALQATG